MTDLRTAAQAVVDQLKHGWVSESDPVAVDLKAALEQDVQCPRCGKVTKPDDIHTCSPRVLTDEVIADLWAKNGTYHHHFARAIERWLRGQG